MPRIPRNRRSANTQSNMQQPTEPDIPYGYPPYSEFTDALGPYHMRHSRALGAHVEDKSSLFNLAPFTSPYGSKFSTQSVQPWTYGTLEGFANSVFSQDHLHTGVVEDATAYNPFQHEAELVIDPALTSGSMVSNISNALSNASSGNGRNQASHSEQGSQNPLLSEARGSTPTTCPGCAQVFPSFSKMEAYINTNSPSIVQVVPFAFQAAGTTLPQPVFMPAHPVSAVQSCKSGPRPPATQPGVLRRTCHLCGKNVSEIRRHLRERCLQNPNKEIEVPGGTPGYTFIKRPYKPRLTSPNRRPGRTASLACLPPAGVPSAPSAL